MEHGNGAPDTPLHTLISLADFKTVLGFDDREDVLSRYCFITAVYTVEHYCKRRLVRRKHTDYLTFTGCLPGPTSRRIFGFPPCPLYGLLVNT
jgi:hypothetical protein